MTEPIMEDVEVFEDEDVLGKPRLVIRSTKFKSSFTIEKVNDGNSFFEVKTTSGQAPPIHGVFTSMDIAKREVLNYIRKSKPTKAVRRDRMTARREKGRGTRVSEEPGS